MKKLLLFAICAVLSVGAYASVIFTSKCGEQTNTVDPSFFETNEEAEEYYMELNEALCE